MARAPKNVPILPTEVPHKRMYEVASDRCAWGKVGEEIELELTDNQELSLLQAGTVKRKPPENKSTATRPNVAVNDRK